MGYSICTAHAVVVVLQLEKKVSKLSCPSLAFGCSPGSILQWVEGEKMTILSVGGSAQGRVAGVVEQSPSGQGPGRDRGGSTSQPAMQSIRRCAHLCIINFLGPNKARRPSIHHAAAHCSFFSLSFFFPPDVLFFLEFSPIRVNPTFQRGWKLRPVRHISDNHGLVCTQTERAISCWKMTVKVHLPMNSCH